MKDRNEKKQGYKKTKVGWIPEDWDFTFLGSVAYVQTGLAKNKKNDIENPIELPYLRVANVQDGFLDLREIKIVEVESTTYKRYLLKDGDVLFTEGGDFDKLGRGTIWRNEIKQCLHQNHIFAVRCKEKSLNRYFLAMLAASQLGRRYFLLSSKQSTNLASINSTQLKAFPLPLPKVSEQNKIAEILSTWDTALSQARKLITQKKDQKKALMQQFFDGKKRYRGCGSQKYRCGKYTDGWNIVELRDLFKPIKRKNLENCERVLTASGRLGLIAQNDYFNSSVAGQSLHNYILLKKGEFAYNRSSMKNFAYGAVRRLDKYDKGVLSTLYICFSLYGQGNISDFYKHYFENNTIANELSSIVQVGARAHGLLNISQTDFFKIKISKPNPKEQSKIAKILNKADDEIVSLEKKLLLLKKQKRGLMQKLLTGEVRVNS